MSYRFSQIYPTLEAHLWYNENEMKHLLWNETPTPAYHANIYGNIILIGW